MEDHAYSFYCKDKYWQRCDDENLEVVKVFGENYDENGVLTWKEAIYRCRVCGGFYKQQYRATYYPPGLFDTDEGWSITDDYFKIDEPRFKTPGSTLDVPFTLSEARRYGYTGEAPNMKNGRCNFPVQNQELTCRAGDLQFVTDVTQDAWDHLRNKLYKCRRCGEWYFFTPVQPHPQAYFKPTNELFPLEAARAYGFEENSNLKSEAPTDSDMQKQAVKTLQIIVQEALVLTPEFVRETPYKVNFFCRVPGDWIENDQLKAEFWKKIADQIFGENWSAETFPIGHYIIKSSETVIFEDDSVKDRNWREYVETEDNLYYFFIGTENGEACKVTADEFQENVDAYFQKAAAAETEPPYEPENLFELNDSLAEAWREPEKLPEAGEWLQYGRSETAQAQYAYIILKKHFARENLRLRKDKLPPSWWSMGWALYLNTDEFVRKEKHSEMLKAMFAELIVFCQAATGEYFAHHLKELLEKLIDDPASRGKIMPLLPANALEQFAEIDRMRDEEYQDYIDRSNQMGY